ncbi:alpha/beta fold hydrolase [Magnetospirillum sp. SS-4]|uniref:alpha/beta fold hydrolase n=1 Tax=Magnetospirillum sp. SS-4 TaxID=2681465 RepID=UPI0013852F98|nr:alpha/beta fold hydrolase [Magnetospirillum sp. SS-4]CAA7615591.1 Lysophospholipase [Magnetospirillum sp. SS-4]
MRRSLVAALLLLLAACAPRLHPEGPKVMEARLGADHWQAEDGAILPLRVWRPDAPPRAVILAVHGMNDYSNAFDAPGRILAERGIVTYAYDQRGFGQGAHPGFWSSSETMAADLRAVARLLRRQYPGVPLYVLGESMGGAVAMTAFAGPDAGEVDGLILSAPAVWGRSTMSVFHRAALWLTHRLAPGLRMSGQGLRIKPSDNVEMLRALSRDPLVIKQTRVDVVKGVVDLMDAAHAAVDRLQLPLLLLYGENDEVIPAAPTWAATARLPGLGRSQRVALYAEGWHMLLRDLQARVVIDDIAAWIEDRDRRLPSEADVRAASRLDGLAK